MQHSLCQDLISLQTNKNALLAAFESQRNVKAVEMMIFVVKIGT